MDNPFLKSLLGIDQPTAPVPDKQRERYQEACFTKLLSLLVRKGVITVEEGKTVVAEAWEKAKSKEGK